MNISCSILSDSDILSNPLARSHLINVVRLRMNLVQSYSSNSISIVTNNFIIHDKTIKIINLKTRLSKALLMKLFVTYS